MIRGIIFDCFGVLYQGSLTYLSSIAPESRKTELYDLIRAFDYGYISHHDYVTVLSDITSHTPAQLTSIIKQQHVRNESVTTMVRQLHKKYKTALLSNMGHDTLSQLFASDEVEALFDASVISGEVGMIKPQLDIYYYTAHKLKLAPSHCIMIDDSQANVQGAIDAGMEGILFTTVDDLTHLLTQKGVLL